MPNGITIRKNSRGIPILGIHWRANVRRDEEWLESERPKYSEAMWRQEYELDDAAMSGERVLADLLIKRWSEIVITDPRWEADPGWHYGAGMDYGKAHPTSFHPYAVGFEGCRYALCEHYQSGNEWTPAAHTQRIREMRMRCLKNEPLVLSKVRRTICDPSMGYLNVAQAEKFTSYIDLFSKAGFPNIGPGFRGSEGMDKALVDEIRQAWSGKEVNFKIVCRGMDFPVEPGSMKKREGTYENGCPNLLWELLNLRRKENTAARAESVGPAEGLVDRDNDGWDDLKYWWTSQPQSPQVSKAQRWQARKSELLELNPDLDIDSLILYRSKFEMEQKKTEAQLSWR